MAEHPNWRNTIYYFHGPDGLFPPWDLRRLEAGRTLNSDVPLQGEAAPPAAPASGWVGSSVSASSSETAVAAKAQMLPRKEPPGESQAATHFAVPLDAPQPQLPRGPAPNHPKPKMDVPRPPEPQATQPGVMPPPNNLQPPPVFMASAPKAQPTPLPPGVEVPLCDIHPSPPPLGVKPPPPPPGWRPLEHFGGPADPLPAEKLPAWCGEVQAEVRVTLGVKGDRGPQTAVAAHEPTDLVEVRKRKFEDRMKAGQKACGLRTQRGCGTRCDRGGLRCGNISKRWCCTRCDRTESVCPQTAVAAEWRCDSFCLEQIRCICEGGLGGHTAHHLCDYLCWKDSQCDGTMLFDPRSTSTFGGGLKSISWHIEDPELCGDRFEGCCSDCGEHGNFNDAALWCQIPNCEGIMIIKIDWMPKARNEALAKRRVQRDGEGQSLAQSVVCKKTRIATTDSPEGMPVVRVKTTRVSLLSGCGCAESESE